MKKIASHIATLALCAAGSQAAENITTAEKVQFKESKVFAWRNGELLEARVKVEFPLNIVIETNGTFTVEGGRPRALQDGDILGRDGMLLRPDGSITPVMDHITQNRGQVLRTDDGDAAAPATALQLGDGTVIRPDRKVLTSTGSASWLQDGELLRPEGGTYPARDTITMQQGEVVVQKEGSMIRVGANRSLTMNDGTKVMGDGTIISFNGERRTLTEGEVVPIEGIIVRRR